MQSQFSLPVHWDISEHTNRGTALGFSHREGLPQQNCTLPGFPVAGSGYTPLRMKGKEARSLYWDVWDHSAFLSCLNAAFQGTTWKWPQVALSGLWRKGQFCEMPQLKKASAGVDKRISWFFLLYSSLSSRLRTGVHSLFGFQEDQSPLVNARVSRILCCWLRSSSGVESWASGSLPGPTLNSGFPEASQGSQSFVSCGAIRSSHSTRGLEKSVSGPYGLTISDGWLSLSRDLQGSHLASCSESVPQGDHGVSVRRSGVWTALRT